MSLPHQPQTRSGTAITVHSLPSRAVDADTLGMASMYELRIDTRQLRILVARTGMPLHDPAIVRELGAGIRAWGALLQARAVRNVTGYPVIYDGQVFRVRVQTGALRGSIELQWPYGTTLAARVFVNGTHTATSQHGGQVRTRSVADYAAAIEEGHDEIDLKKFMKGKTVPFFAARTKAARGPYAAVGLKPLSDRSQGLGSYWHSEQLNARLQAKGKGPMHFQKRGGTNAYQGSSSYFLTFRRVGSEGWIIPAALPRPFMRAAMEGTKDQGRRMLVGRIAPLFQGGR